MQIKAYHTNHGVRYVLIRKKRKYIHVLPMEFPYRVKKVPLEEAQYMEDIEYKGNPYPIHRAVYLFKQEAVDRKERLTKKVQKFLQINV